MSEFSPITTLLKNHVAILQDKADQWDAAQPMIVAMTDVCANAHRICMVMGHGDTAMWDALDRLAAVAQDGAHDD